jgi:hypothetical protein
MKCTGVAYSMGPEWAAPTTIQHWPGKLGHENRNKVDTAVAYDPRTGHPVTWGFLVDNDTRDIEVQELFKLYLDPTHRDEFREQPTLQQARTWFRDYLHYLYQAIQQHFDESLPRWNSKNIEFLFSVPTTWKNPAMIAETEKLIKQAGFGERPNQLVKISLTEAEAAAVFASKQSYQSGDVFLVCDGGGGTTDVNILKVRSSTFGQTELEPMSWVEGQAIGSTLIDFKVQKLIMTRLEKIRDHLPREPRVLAEKMIGDRFETFKCSFGHETMNISELLLPIPGMNGGLDFPYASVRDSKMIITKDELQRIFDEQIEKILKLIDDQMLRLQASHPREQISYLVMSGGFGSSPYLKQRLRKRYELGAGGNLPNSQGIKILSAREPQLVVVHGIVIDRCQELKLGLGIYKERCCRASYGIVVRQPYDALEHQGEDVVIDPRDKKKWAERQIHWFIRQGQNVSVMEGIKHQYRLKIDLGKERVPWKTQIVMSSLPATQLPQSMKRDGVKPVCIVESVLSNEDMKLKNRHW